MNALDKVRALVAEWRAEADDAEVNALEADSIGLNDAAKSSDKHAKLLRVVANELSALLHELQAMARDAEGPLLVNVLFQQGDDPFIFAVHGRATVADLSQIESDVRDNLEMFDKGDGEYQFNAFYFSGQYGEYGRCELPSGLELSLARYAAIDQSREGGNAS